MPSYCQCGDYNVECPQTCYSEWYGHRLRESTVNNPVGAATQAFHAKAYGKDFAYEDFAPMWTNELFNATEWAELFARAGARGLTMTSKHHEGFTLWPSDQSWMWNAVDTGPKQDLLAALSTAVRAKGLKFGTYFSLYEWFNPPVKIPQRTFVD